MNYRNYIIYQYIFKRLPIKGNICDTLIQGDIKMTGKLDF